MTSRRGTRRISLSSRSRDAGWVTLRAPAREIDMLGRDAVVAVHDVSAERAPLGRLVSGLLAELAFRGGERILALLDVAGWDGERDPARSVLVRTDRHDLVGLADCDDRDEVASADREEALDLAAIGKRDAFLGDLHPERSGVQH